MGLAYGNHMKFGFPLLLLGCCLVALTACYTTPEGRLKAGVPGKDRIVSRYEAPLERVYEAAKAVLIENGTLTNDDRVTQVLRGRIDMNTVWIALDDSEPRLTTVTVQVRGSGGGANVELASEIDKMIFGKLITR
jgi:hypothetical protein